VDHFIPILLPTWFLRDGEDGREPSTHGDNTRVQIQRFPYRDWANEFPEVQVSAAGITGLLKEATEASHVAVGFAIILLV